MHSGSGVWRIPSTVPFETIHSRNSADLPSRFVFVHLITAAAPPSTRYWFLVASPFLLTDRQNWEAKERGSNEWRRRKERMNLPLEKHDRPIRMDKKPLPPFFIFSTYPLLFYHPFTLVSIFNFLFDVPTMLQIYFLIFMIMKWYLQKTRMRNIFE